MGQDPKTARAKELRDRANIYRIWLAGRWRIVYEVNDEQIVVLILRVRRKEDIDYPACSPNPDRTEDRPAHVAVR